MELPSCEASLLSRNRWDPEVSGWHIVPTPVIPITGIDKEPKTQGRVVLLSCDNTYGFLSQSLPTLVRWMNEGRTGRKFMVSGFYRVMRNQQRSHFKWIARCFDRSDTGLKALNDALAQYESLLFVIRSPESWRIILPEGCGRRSQQESEPDPEQTSLVDATPVLS